MSRLFLLIPLIVGLSLHGHADGDLYGFAESFANIGFVPQPKDSSGRLVSVGPRVWVNLKSRIYHCPGTKYFGATAKGIYLSEREAIRKKYRPAAGRACNG